jgi:hypothetical protein
LIVTGSSDLAMTRARVRTSVVDRRIRIFIPGGPPFCCAKSPQHSGRRAQAALAAWAPAD